MKVGDGTVFDRKKLYGRMLVVSQQRHIDIRRVFSFELAPHPLSLFDEYGDTRKGTKATRVVVKYRYLYLSTILSVLVEVDVLEYLIGENAKYLYLYLIQSTW